MNRKQKIDFIYKKIADKTLSFGCKIRINNAYLYTDNKQYEDYFWSRSVKCIIEWKYAFENEHHFSKMEILNISFYEKFDFDMKISEDVIRLFEFFKEDEDLKIIGHPVMIWDVLNRISKDTIRIPDCCDYCSRELTHDFYEYRCPSPLCGFSFNVDNEIEDIRIDLVTRLWKYLDRPIEEQDDRCIKFIYDMIQDNK